MGNYCLQGRFNKIERERFSFVIQSCMSFFAQFNFQFNNSSFMQIQNFFLGWGCIFLSCLFEEHILMTFSLIIVTCAIQNVSESANMSKFLSRLNGPFQSHLAMQICNKIEKESTKNRTEYHPMDACMILANQL